MAEAPDVLDSILSELSKTCSERRKSRKQNCIDYTKLLDKIPELPVHSYDFLKKKIDSKEIYARCAAKWFMDRTVLQKVSAGLQSIDAESGELKGFENFRGHDCGTPGATCSAINLFIDVFYIVPKSLRIVEENRRTTLVSSTSETLSNTDSANPPISTIQHNVKGRKRKIDQTGSEEDENLKALRDFELSESSKPKRRRISRSRVAQLRVSKGKTCVECCRCLKNPYSRVYSDLSLEEDASGGRGSWRQYMSKTTLYEYHSLLTEKKRIEATPSLEHQKLQKYKCEESAKLQSFVQDITLSNCLAKGEEKRAIPGLRSEIPLARKPKSNNPFSSSSSSAQTKRMDLAPIIPRKDKKERLQARRKPRSGKKDSENKEKRVDKRSAFESEAIEASAPLSNGRKTRRIPTLFYGDEKLITSLHQCLGNKGIKIREREVSTKVWNMELANKRLKETEDGRIVKEVDGSSVYLYDGRACDCSCCLQLRCTKEGEQRVHVSTTRCCCSHATVKKPTSNTTTELRKSQSEGFPTSTTSTKPQAKEEIEEIHICMSKKRMSEDNRGEKPISPAVCFEKYGKVKHETFVERILSVLHDPNSLFKIFRLRFDDAYACSQTDMLHICTLEDCNFVKGELARYSVQDHGTHTCPMTGKVLKEDKMVDSFWAPSGVISSSGPACKDKQDKSGVINNHQTPTSRSACSAPVGLKRGVMGRDMAFCRSVTCDWNKLRGLLRVKAQSQAARSSDFKALLSQEYPLSGPAWEEYVSFGMVQMAVLLSKDREEADSLDQKKKGKAINECIKKNEVQIEKKHIAFVKNSIERVKFIADNADSDSVEFKSKITDAENLHKIYENVFNPLYLKGISREFYRTIYSNSDEFAMGKEGIGNVVMMDKKAMFMKNGIPACHLKSFYATGPGLAHHSPKDLAHLPGLRKFAHLLTSTHMKDLKTFFPQIYKSLFYPPSQFRCIMSLHETQIAELQKKPTKLRPNIEGPTRSRLIELYATQVVKLWCYIMNALRVPLETSGNAPILSHFPHFVIGALYLMKSGIEIPRRLLGDHHLHGDAPVVIKPKDFELDEILPMEDSSFIKPFRNNIQKSKKAFENVFLAAFRAHLIIPQLFDLDKINIEKQDAGIYPSLIKLNANTQSSIFGGLKNNG